MSPRQVTEALAANRDLIRTLFQAIPETIRHWRPSEGKWSFLEILAHLLEEERLDFRARVQHVLENPAAPMPPINPEGWVTEKKYQAWDYRATLEEWIAERSRSVDYLRQLGDVNWKQVYPHPVLGPVTAETFLYNWLAHDYLHIRQVNRYLYEWYRSVSPVSLTYAGDW